MWRDPRFVVGILLIVVSVLACTFLVSQARRGVLLYEVTRDVAAGEVLDATNTRVVEARPGSGHYLGSGSLHDTTVATRSMAQGELVPASSVAAEGDADHRRLMVTVSDGLPDSAGPGTDLELWFVPTRRAGATDQDPPRLIAPRATLVRVGEKSQGIGSLGGTRIEVRLDVDDLPRVLEATGGDGAVTAVPVGG